MRCVTSADGTEIAYGRSGEGPPLVLIHGSGVDSEIWQLHLDRLAKYFTVYWYDRRGRGESGDSVHYSLEREADDLLALVDQTEEPVSVFGHSTGANVAYEGAKRSSQVTNLVLWEPRVPVPPHDEKPAVGPDLWSYVRNGEEREAKLQAFKRMVNTIPFDTDDFPETVARTPARTMAREIEAAESTELRPEPDITASVLLLDAEKSSSYFRDATKTLAEYLPHSEVRFLPDVGHTAITEDVAIDPVVEFLTDPSNRDRSEKFQANHPS